MNAWTITPERIVPKSPLGQESIIPARYHRPGYHTNDPETPLWKQVRQSIKSPCPPIMQAGNGWYLEYIVITDPKLAMRVVEMLVRSRPDQPCLRHHLMRVTGLNLPVPISETPTP